jgi:branched-chain amino acid aminotransferase
MGQKVFINGSLVDEADAKVSVFDHGYLYGDGVFEGIRSYGGKVFRFDEHLRRLFASAKAISLEVQMTADELKKATYDTMEANGVSDGYIRMVVSRGTGDLGLDPRKCKGNATVVIIAASIQLYPQKLYDEGLEIVTGATVQSHPEALNPAIKSCNYLNNILAKIEGINAGVQEVLMLNHLGYVAECTGDNIFAVRDGALVTPPESAGILRGVTRAVVMELAGELGIPCREAQMTRLDLYTADEVFLTGTAAEIIAVVKIDGRSIGSGKPGPVTSRLLAAFRELTGK